MMFILAGSSFAEDEQASFETEAVPQSIGGQAGDAAQELGITAGEGFRWGAKSCGVFSEGRGRSQGDFKNTATAMGRAYQTTPGKNATASERTLAAMEGFPQVLQQTAQVLILFLNGDVNSLNTYQWKIL